MSVKVNYIKIKKKETSTRTSTYNSKGRCGTSNFVSKSNKLLHKFGITMAYAYTNQFCFMFLRRSFVRLVFFFFRSCFLSMNFLCANLMLHIQKVHKIIARRWSLMPILFGSYIVSLKIILFFFMKVLCFSYYIRKVMPLYGWMLVWCFGILYYVK